MKNPLYLRGRRCVCEWSRFSPVRNAIFVKDSTEQIQFQVCVCVFACMYLRVLLRQKRERESERNRAKEERGRVRGVNVV